MSMAARGVSSSNPLLSHTLIHSTGTPDIVLQVHTPDPEEAGSDHVCYSGMQLAMLCDDVMKKSRAERSNNSHSTSDLV